MDIHNRDTLVVVVVVVVVVAKIVVEGGVVVVEVVVVFHGCSNRGKSKEKRVTRVRAMTTNMSTCREHGRIFPPLQRYALGHICKKRLLRLLKSCYPRLTQPCHPSHIDHSAVAISFLPSWNPSAVMIRSPRCEVLRNTKVCASLLMLSDPLRFCSSAVPLARRLSRRKESLM